MTLAPDPSSAVRGALALVGPERDDDAWEAWLGQRIDPGWRPGEWNRQAWLFTGDLNNPQTSLWRCSVWACVALLHSRHGICRACQIALAAAGAPREEFVASYVPQPKTPTATIKDFCAVSGDGQRCRRPALCQGLCGTHYSSWKNHLIRARAPRSFDDWVSAAEPFTILVPCLVLGCDGPGMNGRGLCTFHWRHWSRDNNRGDRRATAIDWAATQRPYLGPSRFSLIRLAPLVRCEVLFALQQRDKLGRSLCPKAVREVIARLTDVTTLRDPRLGLADLEPRPDAAKAVLRQLRWSVGLAYDEYCGVAAIDKDLLDLRAIGLKSGSRIGRRVSVGTANLAEIPQLWLRALLRAWLDAERPNGDYFHRTLRAAVLAGQALSCRPGGGHDIATLQFADMSAVADQFRNALRRDGRLYGAQERHHLFGRFCELLNFGRYTGLLDDISGSFARHPSHRIILEDPNEDEIGKAIPEFVIRQLDAALDSIALDTTYGELTGDDIQAMFRTVYVILRDTGRRPGEVASLTRDCLETIDGETSLVFDNRKGKRNRRRLPITQDTAGTIRGWQQHRAALPVPERSAGFLFPAISEAAGLPHINPGNVSVAIRRWVDALPTLITDVAGPAGDPVPFDRAKVYPRAFRHTYAQRHADAGTPVDVLKELMDHTAVNVTMGYYRVSLKRKQQAVKTLSKHTIDRAGNPAPFGSPLAYQRSSVAVPFGGCTEPSNVKAGGQACPIRFQCAGCAFYRPDPSYLPAIEQQINDLGADRETADAVGAAEFVTGNLTAQIHAYQEVATTMRARLAELPAGERAEIEHASAILRRARAGEGHTLLPLGIAAREATEQ